MDRVMVGAIHFDQIQRHGGRRGVRDEGLIQAALARPRHKWAYEAQPDLAALAAAYGFGLTKNHGFVDGNKRVAFIVMYVFLGLNGHQVNATEEEVVLRMRDLAIVGTTEDNLAAWIREHLAPTAR